MRALVVLVIALATVGCTRIRTCRSGTVLVTIDAAAIGAAAVQLTLTLDDVQKGMSPPYELPPTHVGTLEVDLGGDYATGRHVVIDVAALVGSAVIGHGELDTTLAPTCTAQSLTLTAVPAVDDMSAGDDLTVASPDLLPGPIVPSHTVATFDTTAPSLPTNITKIDTDALIYVAGGNTVTPGSSLFFADGNNRAILRIGGWIAQSPIRVTGARPLIVIAAGAVDLQAAIDASATNAWSSPGSNVVPVPGPGGAVSQSGIGAGLPGVGNYHAGGGGASFGTLGGKGGALSGTTAGGPGATFGTMLTDFSGGSGGGKGFTTAASCNGAVNGFIPGGAGGGAVQITSATSIIVRAAGGINVGGSGGNPACDNGDGGGGGGGGSGGEIFLEAPVITVAGMLAANGGGGGSGESDVGVEVAGASGTLSATPAAGGNDGKGGVGGNGAAGAIAATDGVAASSNGCGGGGGGAGRIWLRTRNAAADTTGAVISPAAMTDKTL